MTSPYRLLLVEDHTILREGLKSLISAHPQFQIAGEADDGEKALKIAGKINPDLVLIDLSMPRMNGLDAIREIRRQSPNTKILVLTVHKAEEYVFESLKAGADGYLLKDAGTSELMLAMENILAGKNYLSPGISRHIVDGYLRAKQAAPAGPTQNTLTRREKQIVKLIAEGHKTRDIADFLHISEKTVETHRSNLMKKLGAHNAAEVTAYAIENKLTAH
jgi:DNA-binding NarL/FixJ family response regulator